MWLNRVAIDAIHNEQVREHGGLPGLRDENALESALARPKQKWHCHNDADVATLAAAYGVGLAKIHPYRDGNKRIGFLALATFLGLNGYELQATDADVVTEIVALAAGEVSEAQLAEWVRGHSARTTPDLLLHSQRHDLGRREQPTLRADAGHAKRITRAVNDHVAAYHARGGLEIAGAPQAGDVDPIEKLRVA